jgi:opacity protein-like surface antigen
MLTLVLMLATAASAQGQPAPRAADLRDITSARGYAMGGAYRALGQGADAIMGNPAAIALSHSYKAEATGAWDYAQKDGLFGASLLDANTSALAAGLDYHLVSLGRGAERTTAHLGSLAMALPLSGNLYIGSTIRYLMMRGARQEDSTTVDAGVLLRLSDSLTLGVSGHNLVDTHVLELTRYYSAHAALVLGDGLTVAGDVEGDFITANKTTLTYNAGLEYVLSGSIPVRAGYTYDGFTGASRVSAGIGLAADGGGIDLAYRQDFGGENGRLLALTIRLTLF